MYKSTCIQYKSTCIPECINPLIRECINPLVPLNVWSGKLNTYRIYTSGITSGFIHLGSQADLYIWDHQRIYTFGITSGFIHSGSRRIYTFGITNGFIRFGITSGFIHLVSQVDLYILGSQVDLYILGSAADLYIRDHKRSYTSRITSGFIHLGSQVSADRIDQPGKTCDLSSRTRIVEQRAASSDFHQEIFAWASYTQICFEKLDFMELVPIRYLPEMYLFFLCEDFRFDAVNKWV